MAEKVSKYLLTGKQSLASLPNGASHEMVSSLHPSPRYIFTPLLRTERNVPSNPLSVYMRIMVTRS